VKVEQEHARRVQQAGWSHDELEHLVRALSHDMIANFMLLESSFSRVKKALDDVSRPELEQGVAHVEACLRQSKRFLDDLVDLARTGAVEMEPACVDVADVVDEVLFEQSELVADRSVEVKVWRPLPRVWCNRHRLKQVISNLIRNAVKHGCHPKQPRITISSPADGSRPADTTQGGFVSIRIHDNGRGIAPKSHDEIFLPGRRLPTASGDGSGMGLAIVKKIVEYYGGAVYVDSGPQAGTALVLRLPSPHEGQDGGPSQPGSPTSLEVQRGHSDRDPLHDDHRLRPHRALSRRPGRHRSP